MYAASGGEFNPKRLKSWLGTSLAISPREQVDFLEKLVANKLNLSKKAQGKTKEIMYREEDLNGWKLYRKTGGGDSTE
ncbi:penicillin-binding transpeptidase domain-containing protein [Candidatus Amoebophilus asiaticus]|uniref:penicillin-binding transpeptidase domain-containing protein n=1 Tax=Candidatus Amoebophilus asiaticus TaxID=281120 RepID=UPI00373FD32B